MPAPVDTPSPSIATRERPATSDPDPSAPAASSPFAVGIVSEDGDWSGFGDLDGAINAAAAALAAHRICHADVAGCEATVVLASDAVVRKLNGAYRGKDAPTNVLSFVYQPPPAPPGAAIDEPYLGDVILAVETVRAEAAERGIPPVHHLQHLVVHGLLHLIGYDHNAGDEAEIMERLEAEILGSLGVADPYAAQHD